MFSFENATSLYSTKLYYSIQAALSILNKYCDFKLYASFKVLKNLWVLGKLICKRKADTVTRDLNTSTNFMRLENSNATNHKILEKN